MLPRWFEWRQPHKLPLEAAVGAEPAEIVVEMGLAAQPPSLLLPGHSTPSSWSTSWPSIVVVGGAPASRQAALVEWIGTVADNRHRLPEDAAPGNIPATNIRDIHHLPTTGSPNSNSTKTSTLSANAKKPILHISRRGFNNKSDSYSLCALIYCCLLHHPELQRHPPPAVAPASPEAMVPGLFLVAQEDLTTTDYLIRNIQLLK